VSLRRLSLGTSWGELTVVGGSRAGDGTLVLLPQLRLALDAGRPHRALPPMSTVFLSHGHHDHLAGLGYWASQRFLNSMGSGTLLVPGAIAADIARLLEVTARLEGGRPYEVDIVAVEPGDRHRLRADVDLEPFATDHWVPTLGVRILWRRRRLRPELSGLAEEEIARLSRSGEEVSTETRVPVLAYCADTGPELFTGCPEVLDAQVLLLECSFVKPEDLDRARRFHHLHIEDLLEVAPRLGCRHLVLLHPSRRYRLRHVERAFEERLRPLVDCQLHHLNIDWE